MKIEEGAQSDSIRGYELPVCDVNTERRNFKGYAKDTFYGLDEIRQGDFAGTTDTDAETDDRKDNPHYNIKYTKINQTQGPGMRPFKSSSKRTKDN